MSDRRRYARRRRAAVPIALAAFTMLVVVTGSPARPPSAGGTVPAMTVVLPAQVASAPAPAPAETVALPEPPSDPVPLDDVPAPAPASSPADDATASDGSDTTDDGSDQTDDGDTSDAADDADPAPNRHVFLIVLAQTDLVALADDTATAPYLAGTLVPRGTLLTHYSSIARGSLANGIALLSGQGPTAQTLADCPTTAGAAPADVTPDVLGDDGQQVGDGCVYPFATGTVADQLTAAGDDWRAYVESATAACPATPRDPFAAFHSLLDTGTCARRVGGFDRLDADLARGGRAPALLYVVPDACHDGRPDPCAPGAPAGAAAADTFLHDVVQRILDSPAYADGGLIAITSDAPPAPAPDPAAAPATTTTAPVPPPAQPAPTTTIPPAATASGPTPAPTTYPNVGDAAAAGAGRVGALLISARLHAGTTSDAPANHFTLLRAISDLFALQPLGYAGSPALKPLPDGILALDSGR